MVDQLFSIIWEIGIYMTKIISIRSVDGRAFGLKCHYDDVSETYSIKGMTNEFMEDLSKFVDDEAEHGLSVKVLEINK